MIADSDSCLMYFSGCCTADQLTDMGQNQLYNNVQNGLLVSFATSWYLPRHPRVSLPRRSLAVISFMQGSGQGAGFIQQITVYTG